MGISVAAVALIWCGDLAGSGSLQFELLAAPFAEHVGSLSNSVPAMR
jgi:hypothetical protein